MLKTVTIFVGKYQIMVNVHIYVNNKRNAKALVMQLLDKRLVAHASIDQDNASFTRRGDEIIQEVNYVITGQTKALLFNELVQVVDTFTNGSAKIYSLPITQCNIPFEVLIRDTTKPVDIDKNGK